MANSVVFSISTQLEMEGRQLKAVKPNKDGVYEGIPLTVIGCDSRNNVNYEKESVLRCLTDVQSRFAANVSTGDMEGEWGHPFLPSSGETPTLDRLLYIDRKNLSHYFTRVYGKQVGDLIMIYGDVVPFGPYGQYLKESFEDPKRNTSFSLRSAAVKTGMKDGITQKRMLALVTFDAVDGPGFLKASKRFRDQDVASNENLNVNLLPEEYDVNIEVGRDEFMQSQEALKSAGLESIITDQQILDAFCCDKIKLKDEFIRPIGHCQFVDSAGKQISLFHKCFAF